MIEGIFKDSSQKMHEIVERLGHALATLRTGRASISLLDNVRVDYYGTPTPLNQVATLSVPDPTLIVAQPWDPSALTLIEKAIQKSDLGLNPANDGKVVRIPIPPLTEDRRKEMARKVHTYAEEARTSIRQVRRDANEHTKKLQKEKHLSEDDERRAHEKVQKLTDDHIKMVDDLSSKKEKEILAI
jgi:ribosome recycling factor